MLSWVVRVETFSWAASNSRRNLRICCESSTSNVCWQCNVSIDCWQTRSLRVTSSGYYILRSLLHGHLLTQWLSYSKECLTSSSILYRSFWRWVFPVSHLRWYWQPNTNTHTHTHTHTNTRIHCFNGHFPGKPGLAGCLSPRFAFSICFICYFVHKYDSVLQFGMWRCRRGTTSCTPCHRVLVRSSWARCRSWSQLVETHTFLHSL